jgi:nicotinate-nucleotide adenylyltransferase
MNKIERVKGRTSHKIGVFAGTFDPIHNGHLAFAEAAIKSHGLDKVIFIIERQPRGKSQVTPYKLRHEMLGRAIASNANFDIVEAPENQLTLAGTLPYLQKLFKNAHIHFLMGQDVASSAKNWPNAKHLLSQITIIEAKRSGDGAKSASSSQIREAIALGKYSSYLPPAVARYIKSHKLYTSASSE